MPTSIKAKDVYTTAEKIENFCYSMSFVVVGVFTRVAVLPMVLPQEGDGLWKFSLFHIVDFLQVVMIGCPLILLGFRACGLDPYRDHIEILNVKTAQCPHCNEVCKLETYKILKGNKTENFDNIEYSWEVWRTRVHCTECCHVYAKDEDENSTTAVQSGAAEKIRQRPTSKKEQLTEPLLPVEIV
mmetsp:Transcript_6557/g.15946  ORF Transcript_6557/g.15946 Transcript_6557/m.15946 type:complete len:185 (+) Transcript_6557:140-694(+)